MTDPRNLIQRLADDLELWLDHCGPPSLPQEEDESFLLLREARAYLAQPEPEGPTLAQVDDLCAEHSFYYEDSESLECLLLLISDALARYGHQRPAPIPLTERQPTEADCDAEGRCWWWDPDVIPAWILSRTDKHAFSSLWLPHWSLPVPDHTSEER